MTEIKLTNSQCDEVLYYETGFEQLHPQLHIHDWMEEQGCRYREDWTVTRVDHTFDQRSYWKLSFRDPKMAELFVLKWL